MKRLLAASFPGTLLFLDLELFILQLLLEVAHLDLGLLLNEVLESLVLRVVLNVIIEQSPHVQILAGVKMILEAEVGY